MPDDLTLYFILFACAAIAVFTCGYILGRVSGYDKAVRDGDEWDWNPAPKAKAVAAVPAPRPARHAATTRRALRPFPGEELYDNHRRTMPLRHVPKHAGETDTGWMRRVTDDFIGKRIPELAAAPLSPAGGHAASGTREG